MPIYEYTALDLKGKNKTGTIDAESLRVARQKLKSLKIYPISVKQVDQFDLNSGAKEDKQSFLKLDSNPFSRVKASEVSMVTRQLATLLNAGFPLVSALKTLIPQAKTQALKKIISSVKDDIEGGKSFAVAISKYSSVFSPLYINMVKVGESSGTLEIVLERLADVTEKQQELSHRIKMAMAYPILMAGIGVLILFILITFIVPNIVSIFTDMQQNLPGPTKLLIDISDGLKLYWWVLILLIIFIVLIFKRMKKTKQGRYVIDKTLLKIPGLSSLIRKLAVARFSRTLGSLLKNGVSILNALAIVKNIVGNEIIADVIQDASKEVERGQNLNVALSRNNVFPYLSIQMMQVGEQSGKLEEMLEKIASVFEKEVETTVQALTSLLEPLIILVMAVVVSFIVLAICLPIFEMNQLIQ